MCFLCIIRLMYLLILLKIPGAKYFNCYDKGRMTSKLEFRPKKMFPWGNWLAKNQSEPCQGVWTEFDEVGFGESSRRLGEMVFILSLNNYYVFIYIKLYYSKFASNSNKALNSYTIYMSPKIHIRQTILCGLSHTKSIIFYLAR